MPRKSSNEPLPPALQAGVENLSGLSMDQVRLHRNSAKPERLRAQAYSAGNNIDLAEGQAEPGSD